MLVNNNTSAIKDPLTPTSASGPASNIVMTWKIQYIQYVIPMLAMGITYFTFGGEARIAPSFTLRMIGV